MSTSLINRANTYSIVRYGPRFIIRYYKRNTSGLSFSSDTDIEAVGALTFGHRPFDIHTHEELISSLEDYIDSHIYNQIKKDYPDYYLTPRFSPGYGNIPASENSKFLKLADCNFIKALPSGALFPQYSIVFAVGLSKTKQPDHTKCELCKTPNCQFRRNVYKGS